MRTAFLLSSIVALASAQSINVSLISAAPAVSTTAAPVTGTAQTVSAQNSAQASSVGAAAVSSSPAAQRRAVPFGLEKRDGNCAAQPAGTGPAVHSPDTPQAFLNYPYFKAAAYSAPIPKGYTLNFTNLQASTSTSSYMGYTTLNAYDTNQCASLCTSQTGCVAFNLYFERDPTLDPNAQSCPNPPSLTNIKCVFWGVPVSSATATNSGQYRDSFQVVIAGSNGYNVVPAPPSFPGFVGPVAWPGAPNCPVDPVTSISTYIGSKYFSVGTLPGQINYVNTEVCVAACSAQTSVDLANPPIFGKAQVCNQVVSYLLSDSFGVGQGVYCAFYTESWDASYGTTTSVSVGGLAWAVSQAYAYTNATYAASYPSNICTASSCATVYKGGNCGGWGAGTC